MPAGWAGTPQADALACLPFVGIATGALAGLLAWGASFWAPHELVVALAFAAGIVLTGALHLDGFLDSCDALFAAVPASQRLAILKDPHHGTFALAGFAVAAGFWLAAIAALPAAALPWSLAFAGGVARVAAVGNAYRFPYGRAGASAVAFERRPSAAVLGLGLAAALACCWGHLPAALAALPALAIGLGAASFCARRLGGVLTGDTYGAVIVTVEVATLAMLAVLWHLGMLF